MTAQAWSFYGVQNGRDCKAQFPLFPISDLRIEIGDLFQCSHCKCIVHALPGTKEKDVQYIHTARCKSV